MHKGLKIYHCNCYRFVFASKLVSVRSDELLGIKGRARNQEHACNSFFPGKIMSFSEAENSIADITLNFHCQRD